MYFPYISSSIILHIILNKTKHKLSQTYLLDSCAF